jgi:hypothetical protein
MMPTGKLIATSRSNGDTPFGVRIPPPHPRYYLPGGDLHVIVGVFGRFKLYFILTVLLLRACV